MQLGIALYYGEIGNFKDGETEDPTCHDKDMLGNITGKYNKNFILNYCLYSVFTLWNLNKTLDWILQCSNMMGWFYFGCLTLLWFFLIC